MIRVMDLAAYRGIDLEFHIKNKMKYNSLRERMHGKKY
jgi:NTP pyrophosphatase (non-canonical NTP hydrolase)